MTKFGKNVTQRIANEWKTQYIFDFDNGYSASVVRGIGTYGGEEGLFELAVLHNEKLCYDTPITDDVIGWQTAAEIAELLNRIEAL